MIESAYIHIPFCNSICSYCDFTKLLYHEKWIFLYLESLKKEINQNYHQEPLKTIYIGGGTPTSLNTQALEFLFNIIDMFQKQDDYEYTVECNIESLTEEKIKIMKQHGVNRISIGIETFHLHHLKNMNRHHTKNQVQEMILTLKQYGFTNINLDFIYALPNETVKEVEEDIKNFLQLDVPHISTYSLIIEPNTIFHIQKIQPIDEDLDYEMYQTICKTLKQHGYEHYEISNFAKPNYTSKHNLTYWNNEKYYGFGLGASGYIDHIRYTNTKNFNKYCNGDYITEQIKMTDKMNMENEMILGLRKKEGVNEQQFEKKYGKIITSVFPIEQLKKKGQLQIENGWIKIKEEQIYLSNEILIQLLGEIDESNHS